MLTLTHFKQWKTTHMNYNCCINEYFYDANVGLALTILYPH